MILTILIKIMIYLYEERERINKGPDMQSIYSEILQDPSIGFINELKIIKTADGKEVLLVHLTQKNKQINKSKILKVVKSVA